MPTVQVRAHFPENNGFGFYQPPTKDSSGRRIRHGEVFDLYYDENYPLDAKDNKKGVLADWMIQLEKPKKKPGPKKAEPVNANQHVLNA